MTWNSVTVKMDVDRTTWRIGFTLVWISSATILGSDSQCTVDQVINCMNSVLNQTNPITSLPLGDATRMDELCTDITTSLTCVRWVTWSFCGSNSASLMHNIYKTTLNGLITTNKCRMIADGQSAGLAMSFVLSGYYVPGLLVGIPQPTLFRVVGDPKDWLPKHVRTGSGGSKVYVKASSSQVIFSSLAADYWHNKLLWVEKSEGTVNEMPLFFEGSVHSTIIYGALSKKVSAIAVDWVTQSVYVADAGYKWIVQISYKSGFIGYHRIVVNRNISKPTGIVIHPRQGRIFWTDSGLGTLESILVNGEGRNVIKSTLKSPQALCIDYPSERLYWIENGGYDVSSCTVDGVSCSVVISKNPDKHKYIDIDVYEDFLFLSVDKKDLEIYNKTSGEMLQTIKYNSNTRRTILSTYGVTVAAADKQYPLDSLCYFSNGGCEQICLLGKDSPSNVNCSCSLGYTLDSDGRSCQSEPFADEFLLVADQYGHHIYMIDVNTQLIQAVPINTTSEPAALAFDHHSKSVFWIDTKPSSCVLKKTSLNGSDQQTIMTFSNEIIMEIAYDHDTGQIYSTHMTGGKITRLRVGRLRKSLKTVSTSPRPVGIALDISTRTVFWSDWGQLFTSPGTIFKANMDDGSKKSVVLSSRLMYPTALTIDTKARQLYFTQLYEGKVEKIGLDGRGRELITKKSSKSLRSLALDYNFLYIADASDRSLLRCDRKNGSLYPFGPAQFQHPVSIRLINSRIETYVHTTTTTTTTVATTTTTVATTTTTVPTTTVLTSTSQQSSEVTTHWTRTAKPSTRRTTEGQSMKTELNTIRTRPQDTGLLSEHVTTTDTGSVTTSVIQGEVTANFEPFDLTSADNSKTSHQSGLTTNKASTSGLLTPSGYISTTTITTEYSRTVVLTTSTEPITTTSTTFVATTTENTHTRRMKPASTTSRSRKHITTTTTQEDEQTGTEVLYVTTNDDMSHVTSDPEHQSTPRSRTKSVISVRIEESRTTKKSDPSSIGLVFGAVFGLVLVALAVAGFVWYRRKIGSVHIFHPVVARFSRRDDTVTLTEADTPVSDPSVSRDPDTASLDDLYPWQSGDTEC